MVDACSDALYDMEGIAKGVSMRTVQADIQIMRSDKLGYNAPIEVYYIFRSIPVSAGIHRDWMTDILRKLPIYKERKKDIKELLPMFWKIKSISIDFIKLVPI